MNKLTENHFSFKCPMNWDDMEVSGSGRHCCKCRKQVFDLTNCTIDEVIALQRKHGPICGSIKVIQTATIAISLSAAACQNVSSPRIVDKPVDRQGPPFDMIAGGICPPEQLENMKTHGADDSLKSGDPAINRNSISGVPRPPEQLEKMKQR